MLAGLFSNPLLASVIAIDYSLTLAPTDVHPGARDVDGRLTFEFDPLHPAADSFAVLSHDLMIDGTLFHALPESNGSFGVLSVTDNATPGEDADTVYFYSNFDFFPATPAVGRAFLWWVAAPSFFPTADGLWDFSKVYNRTLVFDFDSGAGESAYEYDNLVVASSLVNEVGEPAPLALFGVGLLGMFALRRRSRLR